jgi:hypothetical protein
MSILINAIKKPWNLNKLLGINQTKLSVGTCHGLIEYTDTKHILLAVMNNEPHNGDFQRFMDFIEAEARNAGVPLYVIVLWNKRLRGHLIGQWGYIPSKKGLVLPPAEHQGTKAGTTKTVRRRG